MCTINQCALGCIAVLGERDRPGPIMNYCTTKRAEALTKSGLYLSYVRLSERLEGNTPDAADRTADGLSGPFIELACSTAALLGSATFAAECIFTDSVDSSVVTGAPGFASGLELGNIGGIIGGKPPSPVLKVGRCAVLPFFSCFPPKSSLSILPSHPAFPLPRRSSTAERSASSCSGSCCVCAPSWAAACMTHWVLMLARASR
jgi:hypothetical protein